jgi:hypothetical protein
MKDTENKFKLLRKGILLDLFGVASTFIPVIGPFLDIVWAPFAAKQMSDMYKGNKGKIATWIVFLEEILPGTDFIPTFTLMWLYTFVVAPQKEKKMQPIEVDVND